MRVETRDTDFLVASIPSIIRTLLIASRPSQIALVVLLYAVGIVIPLASTDVVADPVVQSVDHLLSIETIPRLVLGLGLLLLISLSLHYANEVSDMATDRRTERTPFSGGSGALVRNPSHRLIVWQTSVVFGVAAAFLTLVSAYLGIINQTAGVIAIAGLILGLAYSVRPIRLVDRGLGEVTNVLLGTILLPIYGIAMMGTPTVGSLLVVLPFAMVVGCNLLATHWPDRYADASIGKRTVVVRFDPTTIRTLFSGLILAYLFLVLLLWWVDMFPLKVFVAHVLVVPLLLWGRLRITRQENPLPSVIGMVILAIAMGIGWSAIVVGVPP